MEARTVVCRRLAALGTCDRGRGTGCNEGRYCDVEGAATHEDARMPDQKRVVICEAQTCFLDE